MAVFSQMRYLVFMMGFFAFYNGWIYNEFFAIPFEVFGSCYDEQPKIINWDESPEEYGYKRLDSKCVYTAGLDPRWF